ncbi:hypothetical protein AB6A40_006403 [Gnathostoma spinigerum]|uniref:Uncharacterized protein n=1 Tax=Gnathostoma spinigerum TaxID=75299 RepID=A0ABD6EIA7_9BILA
MLLDSPEISTATEVEIPLELSAHEISCASHNGKCTCSLVRNEVVIFRNFDGAKCIKSRMIQLRVRRTQDIGDDGVSSAPRDVNITDAYLVSVDKDHIKEMNKKLKRHYPGIKTHDMEAVASAPDDNHQQTPSNSKSSPSHENIEPQKQSFNFDLYDSGNGSSSPPSEDQRERLKKYEKDLKKRKELDEQKAKEYAFLRASLRGSRKLRALEDNRTKSADVNDGEIPRMKTEPFGYSNRCYISADNSYRENLDSLQNEPIRMY